MVYRSAEWTRIPRDPSFDTRPTKDLEVDSMEKIIGIYAPHAYAMMRIVVGLLFICHGLQKVFGMFGGMGGGPVPLFSLFGVAGSIEIIGGAFITVGFFAGYVAFIASGEMAVAYFIGHFS
jgi:putative oxidoreductase